MKLFLDTANLAEIREIKKWGVLGGLTSNPTLIAKEKPDDIETYMKELCAEVDGPVSLETTAVKADEIYEQGIRLSQIAPNAVVNAKLSAPPNPCKASAPAPPLMMLAPLLP